jgi:6-phospho-beta-glucosidase
VYIYSWAFLSGRGKGMGKLKAAVIGAGSTYTPELIEGFLEFGDELPFDCISLMDIDEYRLNVVGSFARRQLRAGGYKGDIELVLDLDKAVYGSSFVFGQVRVGKMAARIRDEKIPLKYDLIGQETTGAGGFMKALRTIPVVMNMAETMKKSAADGAWLVNFSNPSGIVAEAVLNNTDVNMIGLCNCPINMLKEIGAAIGTDEFDYEYVGLNHLSWITSISVPGSSETLSRALMGGEGMKNVPKLDIDPALLKAVPYIPSSYLSYFSYRDKQLEKCKKAEKTRGEICLEVEEKLYSIFKDESVCTKPEEISQRGGSMYSTAAIKAVSSIYNDKGEYHVVDAKNKGAIPFMDDDDIVEVKCKLGKSGVVPQPVSPCNDFVVGLMRAVKAYEKLTVKAALEGSYDAALAALLVHPLIGDFEKAKGVLDEMLEANKEFVPQFFR